MQILLPCYLKIRFSIPSVYPLIFCSRAIWHSPHKGRQAMTTQSSHTEPWEEAQAQEKECQYCLKTHGQTPGLCISQITTKYHTIFNTKSALLRFCSNQC